MTLIMRCIYRRLSTVEPEGSCFEPTGPAVGSVAWQCEDSQEVCP